MALTKKKLFIGVVLGSLGISLYNSIKNYKETFKSMKKTISNHPANSPTLLESSTIDNNVRDSLDELKKQTNILEKKLNDFQN
jgi:hypothetical protein